MASQMSFAQLEEHCQRIANELAEAQQKLRVYESQVEGDLAGALTNTQKELEKIQSENAELVAENRRMQDALNDLAAENATLKLSHTPDPSAVP